MKTVQIIVTDDEKKRIESIVTRMSMMDNVRYSVSSFLSQSIMDVVTKLESELPMFNSDTGRVIDER